ncbi:MAG: hypothetical protein QM579_09125 [Desulfovibrio sp.]|uniref:hypothetical protein n=1 Tax=Desulfovibrio sp. TaxID=885 RepID=UPI0039E27A68
MKLSRRPFRYFSVLLVLAALVAACVSSGPQKALNGMAEALKKNDSAAFLAGMDLKSFANNDIKNMTKEEAPLGLLDSLGRSLGIGGMDELLGSIVDMEARLHNHFNRGVSTGELMAQCRQAETPNCPWVPESLNNAKVTEIGSDAAVAQITTPARMTSWLALRKIDGKWLVVGQAVMESTARQYAAGKSAPAAPAAPSEPKPQPAPEKPAPGQDTMAGDNQSVTKI